MSKKIWDAEKFRILQAQNQLKARDIALKLETYEQLIYLWKKGFEPTKDTVVKLAKLFKCSVNDFYSEVK